MRNDIARARACSNYQRPDAQHQAVPQVLEVIWLDYFFFVLTVIWLDNADWLPAPSTAATA
jgi:hypothetical protein